MAYEVIAPDQGARDMVSGVLSRFAALREERLPYEPMWREITDYLYPRRSGWDWSVDASVDSGAKIFDGEAIAAHNRLADGIFGWLCSPSIDWLKVEPADRRYKEDRAALVYSQDLVQFLYEVFAKSNFYDAMSEDIHDCSALGTSVLAVEEAADLGCPVYLPLHLREVFISEDRHQSVDTLFRQYESRNRHLLEEFPEAFDERERRSMSQSPESRAMVLHAMFPRRVYDDGEAKVRSEKPFASVYILLGTARDGKVLGGKLLEDGGTDFQRFAAWRFRKAGGQVYGTCPGMDAIWDTKMMNLQSKTMADVAQLAARPPMQAPESLKGKIKIAPGAMNYRIGDEKIEPVITTVSYPFGIDAMERRAKLIRELFKTDYFNMISAIQASSRQRTATEIMELKSESAAVLGPIVGRCQTERIDRVVRLTILNERAGGRLPPPPKSLAGDVAFKLVYTGPLAQAQRKFLKIEGITRGLASALQFVQVDPLVTLNFKMNESVREIATANGFPQDLLEAPADVDRMQEAARKAQAAAQAREEKRMDMQAAASGGKAPEAGSLLAEDMAAIAMNGGM